MIPTVTVPDEALVESEEYVVVGQIRRRGRWVESTISRFRIEGADDAPAALRFALMSAHLTRGRSDVQRVGVRKVTFYRLDGKPNAVAEPIA